jgi:hypothetical protein
MFADIALEVAPVNPDGGKLAEVGARHGLKVEGDPTSSGSSDRTLDSPGPGDSSFSAPCQISN